MGHPNTLRACAIAGTLVFTGAAGVLAQDTFQINGRVKVDGGGLDGARVVVFKNGEKQRTLNSGLSKFSIDLDLNADYILAFEKDGFVTKKLSFDTKAPAEAIANGFTPFEFAVSLFKQYDGVNTVVFSQPVGMIRYDQNTDDFDYDTDYTKSIQSALEQALNDVAAKQVEEKGNDAAESRRAEEEAKAKAKAEAEAAKQRAKQEKEAADAAKREQQQKEAEAKKAEAAAKKAEQERLVSGSEKKAEPERKPAAKPRPEPVKAPLPPVAKAERAKPVAPPPPPVVARSTGLLSEPRTGDESRRGLPAKEVVEESPVRQAEPREVVEAIPELRSEAQEIVRNEELIVEPNQVITRIELDNGKERTEYRRVVHKFGQIFYFKDGLSISKIIYEREALAENR